MEKENRKFVVYKSSAGSGKTFTLVREYLKIVLQNPDLFRQVLAITFTNKAANEMKERVIRNLFLLAHPENNREEDAIKHLLPHLMRELNLSEPQVSFRASAVLHLIMHHYSEFAISTIDSFTHRVIRTFAHDLQIPMNFEVELDAETMLSHSVDLLISQVGSNQQLTQVMVDFVEKKAGDEMNWQIERDLNEFGGTLLSESSISALEEIRKYDLDTFMKVRTNLLQWKSAWEKNLKNLASTAVNLIDMEGIAVDSFNGKSKSILPFLQNLAHEKFDRINPGSYVQKSLETGEWINPKAPAADRMAFHRIAPELLKSGKLLLNMIENELPRYALCRLLLGQLFSSALLGEIEKTLNSLCQENNKLLISEFNRRIAQVVKEQPAPFIYERLGERYHHYLIDEFQDTSILQWHNLLPLVENSLASSWLNLVVGDAKQAIYRWRSGDAEQFGLLPRLLKERPDPLLDTREKALINHYKEEYLDRNHRSSPVIVDFNNRLFASVAQSLPPRYGEVFSHAAQDAAKKDKPGMVKLERIVQDEDDDRNYEEIVHDKILSVIHELQEDRFLLKDIAILCRENKRAAKIASFLIRHDIPVISSESLLLTQSEQVRFLLSWMKHLVDLTDGIPMANILRYVIDKGLITGFRLEDFFSKENKQPAVGFAEILARHFPFIDFNHLKSLELFGLIRFLIVHFNLNSTDDSYIRFFQDVVLEFVKDRRGGLPEFLEWWEDISLKASVVIPEGINAVRIMTIHKAKGLQFPAVIFPHADEQVRPTRKNLWVPLDEDFARPLKTAFLPTKKSLKETNYEELYDDEMNRSVVDMVNVLYVALTRPEERLYVLSRNFPEKTDGPASVPKLLSRFLKAEGKWEDCRDLYQYGERWQRSEPAEQNENEEVSDNVPIVCSDAIKMLLRPHAPAAWDMEEPEKNRKWGNLIHMAMSKISRADQVVPVLQELLVNGLISSAQQVDLSVLMAGILANPEMSVFFDPGYTVMNEPEILTPEGFLYRPDRVLIKQDHVIIIDFKTGKQRNEHYEQVLFYSRLLKEMNYKVDGVFLLYLDRQPEVLRVI